MFVSLSYNFGKLIDSAQITGITIQTSIDIENQWFSEKIGDWLIVQRTSWDIRPRK